MLRKGAAFEKGIEEQTTSDSRVTFKEYCDHAVKIKEQPSVCVISLETSISQLMRSFFAMTQVRVSDHRLAAYV
ncbi:MAG: hypothetical protein IKP47_10150 [Ruminococcus sp.]|nr:hypothetical protein [Ruminococcus sp.]